jgi:hypothetical protein
MDETQFLNVKRFNNPDAVLKELNIKMGKVSSVLDKIFVTDSGVVIKPKVVELHSIKPNTINLGTKTISKPQNKKIGANKFGKFLK